ncbi:MAG TPA: hypothetical protein VFC10_07590 [Terriglobia bacterium]|jgi:hypothetical protein|nr:hypothetical protein [Terriglobia bacterium]
MSELGFTVFEYLIWVALAIGLVVILFVCLALGVALSSAVSPLASKWRLVSTARKSRLAEPNRVRPIQFNSLRRSEPSADEYAARRSLADQTDAPEASLSMRKAS